MALAVGAAFIGLRPIAPPPALAMALVGAVALAAILALGAAGLGLLRGRSAGLAAPGLGALVLSLVSLLCAWRGDHQLVFLAVLNLALAAGLLLRAVRLDRQRGDHPQRPDGGSV